MQKRRMQKQLMNELKRLWHIGHFIDVYVYAATLVKEKAKNVCIVFTDDPDGNKEKWQIVQKHSFEWQRKEKEWKIQTSLYVHVF